jgi:streptogramin lyase
VAHQVRRVAGSTTGGMTQGADRLGDTFRRISGLVVTPAAAFIVADTDANQIRRLPATGATQLIAGLADGSAGYDASTNATTTRLNQPHGLAYDAVAGDVYVCDTGNNRIRYLAGGVLTDLVGGGTDTANQVAVATNAQLGAPMGLARDAAGNLFFTERNTSRVRRYDAGSGAVSTLATGPGNGPIALDETNGLIWVANGGVVTAISGINGGSPAVATASTFACRPGTGTPQVTGLAYDGAGTLYIAQASFPGAGAPVDGRILRVAVDASGQPTADPVVIAGTGGQSANPAAYGAPLTDTDGLTSLLANTNWCALTVGPGGQLHAGNSYPGQWGQVLRLTP